MYAFLVIFCVYTLYNMINVVLSAVFGTTDVVYLGVEPFLFGIFCMGFDMLFIWMRRLFGELVRNAKAAS